jgi:hypothetical protein
LVTEALEGTKIVFLEGTIILFGARGSRRHHNYISCFGRFSSGSVSGSQSRREE